MLLEPICHGLYRLELPLPENPLRSANSYIIKGEDRNLIIDTGMNSKECRQAFEQGLGELEIDIDITDILFTHMHPDHTGLIMYLHRPGCNIYGSAEEVDMVNELMNNKSRNRWKPNVRFALANGFIRQSSYRFRDETNSSGIKIPSWGSAEFTVLDEGDALIVGGFKLEVIKTPGHSQGHICLYEREKKIIFTGDHILGDITPSISIFEGKGNPLGDYMKSLTKMKSINADLALPGHRSIIHNHQARIEEIIEHHQMRCSEIMSILEKRPANVFQVASQMKWNMTYSCWHEFPDVQKYFAFGETAAHLKYLAEKGELNEYMEENKILYSL